MTRASWVWLGLAALLSSGCDATNKSSSEAKAEAADEDDDEPKKKSKKKSKDDADPASTGSAEAPAAPKADAPAAVSGAPPASPMPVLPGRSAVPTLEEWNAVTKEVNVKGSSALQCETKMLREWLRVSCRGKNDTGGTPVSVITQKGGFGAYLFASGGVTSIVLPFVEGIDATFVFAWTDKSHPLHLSWPRRSPMPNILGEFEGARSPLNGSGLDVESCKRCTKELADMGMGAGVCDIIGNNKFCRAQYGNDCESLYKCGISEPAYQVTCPAGTIKTWHNWCSTPCGPGKPPCPGNHTCDTGSTGDLVCIPN